MSEQNVGQVAAEEVTKNGTGAKGEPEKNPGPFATVEELKANPPSNPNFRPFEVTAPDGTKCYTNSRDGGRAIATAAKAAGWSASQHGRIVSVDTVAGMAEKLSPEDRKRLLKLLRQSPSAV